MKAFPCKVGFEGYDWRNEFTVHSEKTGVTLRVQCNGKWDQMSPELTALIEKYHGANEQDLAWSSAPIHPENLTRELMEEIKRLANYQPRGGKKR